MQSRQVEPGQVNQRRKLPCASRFFAGAITSWTLVWCSVRVPVWTVFIFFTMLIMISSDLDRTLFILAGWEMDVLATPGSSQKCQYK